MGKTKQKSKIEFPNKANTKTNKHETHPGSWNDAREKKLGDYGRKFKKIWVSPKNN